MCICFSYQFYFYSTIQDATKKPKLDDLNRSVRPKVARRWRDLGIELLSAVENGVEKLDIIRENNPRDVEACCTEMFQFWLDNANDASWRKLVEAVKVIGYNVLAKDLEEVSVYVFNIVNTENKVHVYKTILLSPLRDTINYT